MHKIITPVAVEPLSLGDVKLHLRLTADTTEDDLLDGLITAAREYCEDYTGRALATQIVELLLDAFPATDSIKLPMPPLQSVTFVKYKDHAGVETTLAASGYVADADSDVGRVVLAYGQSWPSFTAYPSNPIRIRYVTGYVNAPQKIRQAMLLLIGHWYENREGTIVGTISKQTDLAVKALLTQHRVRWWD